ncbi:MAG: NDP-sugar synthase [Candidatus Thermoplasmatota archaeon]|nr:NDP-sugar synthase [Candidatus Thermoplasmatota archaeon]
MQAVILSGGFGTRMRPLTYTTPKPLLPLLNKPLIMHLIDSLPAEVEEVVLAANYKIEMLEEFFEDLDMDREVHVVDEPEPRGTGGAVKNVEEYIDDTFFVINSDVISSIDLKDYLEFYRKKEGVGAISAWEVEDPTAYGIMDPDEEQRIQRFQEKPKPEEAFSNLINAGHYILEREVLDKIPPRRKVSIEHEIFPKLLEDGLYSYQFSGYWIDCGTPTNFFEAHRTLLDVEDKKTVVDDRSWVDGELGDYVSVGMDCTIEDCEISNSILFDGVEIDEGAKIENSILGYDVIVEEGVKIKDSIVSDNVYLEKGEKIIKEDIKPEGVEDE